MARRREKVFISYSSKNDRFVREEILPQVKRAKRDHWFAPKSIGGGDDWRIKLLDGLEDCRRLLVVVSKEALESGYVKDEVANAAKKLLTRHARLDARRVHRAILPVKIDERGKYGEKIPSMAPQPGGAADAGAKIATPIEVDPHLIHPYLTLVNFITIPHNEVLNRQLDQKTGTYLGNFQELTPDQRRSIREYATERKEARNRLVTAIRDPDALRRGFSRVARLIGLLGHANVQRLALATGLLAAIFLLFQLPRNLLWPAAGRSDLTIDVTSDVASPPGTPEADAAFSVDLSQGPRPLLIRAKTNDDEEAFVRVVLRANGPKGSDGQDPTDTPPGATPSDSEDPPEIHIERVAYQARSGDAESQVKLVSVSQDVTYLRVRAQANGLESMQYVKIQPDVTDPPDDVPAADAEIEIKTARQIAGKRVDGQVKKLGGDIEHISLTNDPTALFIRANVEDKTGHWRLVRLHPPQADPPREAGVPELEVTRVGEDGRVMESFADPQGQLAVTDDPVTFLRIAVKSANGTVIERRLKLLTRPIFDVAELEISPISQRDRGLQNAMRANEVKQYVASVERPAIFRVVATSESGKESRRYVHVRSRQLVPPEPPESGPPRILIRPEDPRTIVEETSPNNMRIGVARRGTRLRVQAQTDDGKLAESFVALVPPPPIVPELTFQTDPPPPRTAIRQTGDTHYTMRMTQANTDLGVFAGDGRLQFTLIPPPQIVPDLEFRTDPPPPRTLIQHIEGTHYNMQLMQENTNLGVFAGGKQLSFTLVAPRSAPRVTFQTDPPRTRFQQVNPNGYVLQLSQPTDLKVFVGREMSTVRIIPPEIHSEVPPHVRRFRTPNQPRYEPAPAPGPYEGPISVEPPVLRPPVAVPRVSY